MGPVVYPLRLELIRLLCGRWCDPFVDWLLTAREQHTLLARLFDAYGDSAIYGLGLLVAWDVNRGQRKSVLRQGERRARRLGQRLLAARCPTPRR